jgi:hypothetical protein
VGIDIDANASQVVDLSRLEVEGLQLSLSLEDLPKSKVG